jgi:hypothetical protein
MSLAGQRDASVRQFAVTQLAEQELLTPAALSILVQRLADPAEDVRFKQWQG